MATIKAPDIPGPRKQLCWRQDPKTLLRCDRAKGHGGACSWQVGAELGALKAALRPLAKELRDLDAHEHSLTTYNCQLCARLATIRSVLGDALYARLKKEGV